MGFAPAVPGSRRTPRFSRLLGAFEPGEPWKSRRSPRRGGRGAVRREGRGSGVTERPAQPASWSWGSGRGALEEPSCLANLQEKFGSPRLRAGPPTPLRRSPSATAAGGDTRPRAESRGPPRACLPRPGAGAPGRAESGGYAPASRAELGCRDPRGDANPAVRLGGRRANDPSQMNPSNSRTGRCQVSDRLPGARPSPPAAGPRALGGALRSVPATPTDSTPSPATCRDASISWKRQRRREKKRKKRERAHECVAPPR